jgi:sugar lactone lactonase YvrE
MLLCSLIPQLFAQSVTTIATIQTNFGDGMIVAPNGNVLVSGGYNKDNILKITSEGVVSDYVTGLPGPVGMGFDSQENLYVSNYSGNSISKVTPEGVVTEFATGLDGPAGLMVSDEDEVFVTLYGANFSGNGKTVLKFDLNGNSEVVAFGSGIKDAVGITMDENHVMYVTNLTGGNVFEVDTNQNISNFSSVSGANINQIVYADNYVYLPSPNLRKIYRVNTLNGEEEHYAGTGGNQIADGQLLEAQFNFPNSCAISKIGDTLYILDGKLGKIRMIDLSNVTGIDGTKEVHNKNSLQQNFPNPFYLTTSIHFTLNEEDFVTLTVYDLQGKKVEQLINTTLNAGNHSVLFSANNITAGFYFYQLATNKFVETKKMLLQR